MSRAAVPLLPLLPEQAAAADPAVHAWVAASAGTGKTQVLTARVLRLLLDGARPASILCLTFTRAGAAEMQLRVMDRLAHWASCDAAALASDLAAIGASPAQADAARRLFAAVLDSPAGLAIQTIHGFAQGLIASFPVEAGVTPGFAALDDRAAALLQRRVLADLVNDALGGADALVRDDLEQVALDGGETRLAAIMAAAASHADALAALRVEGVDAALRRFFALPAAGTADAAIAAALARVDRAELAALARALGQQAGSRAQGIAGDLVAAITLVDRAEPAPALAGLWKALFTNDDAPRAGNYVVPNAMEQAQPGWRERLAAVQAQLWLVRQQQDAWACHAVAARHLRLAVRLARDWQAAKARTGTIDYADMISAARRLLGAPDAAAWVRFKLDARIDHVLVDEAQDTNTEQWDVIEGLVHEYFSGQGARDQFRSLFVVGDFKQSIFSFQGADPRVYRDRREHFASLCDAQPERWKELALDRNFRSSDIILDAVDAVLDAAGAEPFGGDAVPRHLPFAPRAGCLMLWPPLVEDAADADDDADDEGPGLSATIAVAQRIAATIAGWLDPGQPLILPASGRRVQSGDIMVLVRRRAGLMNALVTALHERGVPVAGADRLNLAEPLAVADLLALIAFAVQPADDLALAGLLVSPLVGLDHDQLTHLAARRPGRLWDAVRASMEPAVVAARAWLDGVLDAAQTVSPYRFLEQILSGPAGGRARLLGRLGEEARDAIDAVLDQALACEAAGAASLQAFLAWMAAGDLEVKRDPEAAVDAVRLMTVHGAKGLEAPVVILADACATAQSPKGPVDAVLDNQTPVPLWLPSGLAAPPDPVAGLLAERAQDAGDEDARLLYVAMTRAREILCVGGAAKPTRKHVIPPASWYARIDAALSGWAWQEQPHPAWPQPMRVMAAGTPAAPATAVVEARDGLLLEGDWWRRPAPVESRPPRPLAPSALVADPAPAPPPSPQRRAAARRGQALHRLFELLPAVPPPQRAVTARHWCRLNVPDLDADDLVATVTAVLDAPEHAALFAASALAEAPVSAVVGGTVIAGTIDRLSILDDEVLALDFKTGARVPADAASLPPAHVAQMGAYAAALAAVFPGRTVRAALLYTAGPRLIEVPAARLAAWAGDAADAAPLQAPAIATISVP